MTGDPGREAHPHLGTHLGARISQEGVSGPPEVSHEHSDPLPHAPVLNYCPTCGTPLEDRQAFGRMRRYCPSCERIIFREHKVAAGLLISDGENRILLVRRALKPQQGLWSLPAGFVDVGESPAEAAVRECQEETGLDAEIVGLVDVIAGREHDRGADIVIVYQGKVTGGILRAADDAAVAAFFAADELPPLAFEATRRAVRYWRRANDSAEAVTSR